MSHGTRLTSFTFFRFRQLPVPKEPFRSVTFPVRARKPRSKQPSKQSPWPVALAVAGTTFIGCNMLQPLLPIRSIREVRGALELFSISETIALRTHGLSSLSKSSKHVKSHCASFHLELVSTSPALFATWKHRKSIYGKIIQQPLLSLLNYSLPLASSQSVPWPSGTASNVEDLWHIWHMWPLVTCRVESSLPCFNKGQLQSCSRNILGIFQYLCCDLFSANGRRIPRNHRKIQVWALHPCQAVRAGFGPNLTGEGCHGCHPSNIDLVPYWWNPWNLMLCRPW